MIRQRFLYVGIGGSGLDIGRELTEALTREVCGLDGRRLQARDRRALTATRRAEPQAIPVRRGAGSSAARAPRRGR